ncbi:MAG TPA: hypothetical protein VMT62_08805 [Syntrophorhabdaceae bacterium]|nr:hypothetical protein [Syntrophorhabdaceae bacterium]
MSAITSDRFTWKFWSAGEIVKKLHGVTTRQILDLAEKRFITPARETIGAGSPRLYDFQNIFEICICLALRGKIPAGIATKSLVTEILDAIKQRTGHAQKDDAKDNITDYQEKTFGEGLNPTSHIMAGPPFDLLLIAYDNRNNYSCHIASYDETFKKVLHKTKKYRPQDYCTYTIEVSALWTYLKTVF